MPLQQREERQPLRWTQRVQPRRRVCTSMLRLRREQKRHRRVSTQDRALIFPLRQCRLSFRAGCIAYRGHVSSAFQFKVGIGAANTRNRCFTSDTKSSSCVSEDTQ